MYLLSLQRNINRPTNLMIRKYVNCLSIKESAYICMYNSVYFILFYLFIYLFFIIDIQACIINVYFLLYRCMSHFYITFSFINLFDEESDRDLHFLYAYVLFFTFIFTTMWILKTERRFSYDKGKKKNINKLFRYKKLCCLDI